ncbi:tetraacyldisaccharide 4'-kinase [Candidatus Uabimicrobium sp. HlEnr_7]|uniref:tetraacyldisaccharide 4'-kinase n=1 Tax=Candidatus Uabimicrobium helgolandensis TaxID=3095367 RepID=UPI003557F20E
MSKTSFVHQLQTSNKPIFFLLRPILKITSAIYGLITHGRNVAYRYNILKSKSLITPVISVGNIIAGGTGKTPTVIWLIQNFPLDFPKAILLSRGYGGDEQQIFAKTLPDVPHFTGSKRFDAAQRALKEYGENIVFVLDDGFQHQQLQRDLDIVLIDATCPFGYKHMLPRGFLREYLSNLKRADAFIITRSDMVTAQQLENIQRKLKYIAGEKPQAISQHVPAYFVEHSSKRICDKNSFVGKRALLFCGIGNPQSFYYLVENLGIEVVELKIFDDHYQYNAEDIADICSAAREVDMIITTSKDAVKIREHDLEGPLWILEITIDVIKGKEQLMKLVEDKIKERQDTQG